MARQPDAAEEYEVLQYMQQLYQNQYALLMQEINSRMAAFNELGNCSAALASIEKLKGANTLLDIGAGTYLQATISGAGIVLVPVGAGYYVEMQPADAQLLTERASQKHRAVLERLEASRRQLEEMLVELSFKLGMFARGTSQPPSSR